MMKGARACEREVPGSGDFLGELREAGADASEGQSPDGGATSPPSNGVGPFLARDYADDRSIPGSEAPMEP